MEGAPHGKALTGAFWGPPSAAPGVCVSGPSDESDFPLSSHCSWGLRHRGAINPESCSGPQPTETVNMANGDLYNSILGEFIMKPRNWNS